MDHYDINIRLKRGAEISVRNKRALLLCVTEVGHRSVAIISEVRTEIYDLSLV